MTTDRLSREHPQVKKVLSVLSTVGFQRPLCLGRVDSEQGVTLMLGGGIDLIKALQVRRFLKTVVDKDGSIHRSLIVQRLLEGRRALLADVIDTVQKWYRMEVIALSFDRTDRIDSTFVLKMGGVLINLILMTH